MILDTIYRNGVNRVWGEDTQSQREYLKVVSQCRGMDFIDFESMHSIFIPNDNYLFQYFDSSIGNQEFGFFDYDNRCFWNNCLIMPIYDVADKVRSVVGFNPFSYVQAKETNDWSINYYTYASAKVFRRGAFLFYCEGDYSKALDDGYLFLTDGVFDAVSLHFAGFNAAAMMGSNVTPEIISMLRFVRRVLVVCDNDEAGYKLVQGLRRVHPGIVTVKQGATKDIDEVLKSEYRDQAIAGLRAAISGSESTITLSVR